ncbi:MAG: DUF2235 domain-containing protein [Xanthomonadales bacterium]|nr:DUF2235 domain-containing protein [Xanthomonadales bacterium]
MKRLILCLDGTWNSAYAESKRDDGIKVLKPSNVLKLARGIEPEDDEGNQQVVYYDTGVGSLAKYPGFANWFLSKVDKTAGGAWGAGFEANIEDALTFIVNNYNPGEGKKKADEVLVFGFSRGAATARALTQFISWMDGMPVKADAYFLPKLFRIYVKAKGKTTISKAKEKINKEIDKVNETRKRKIDYPFQEWNQVRINFLGVWDTVLALGGRVVTMKSRKFYLSDQPAKCVDHARQALAIDEQRYDFLPEVWQSPSFEGQTLEQNWFAGVHSNIGGGYANDGLANITLHWMVNRIKDVIVGFKTNDDFLNIYGPFPQDEMVDSKTKTYKAKDFVMRKKGMRKIITNLDNGYQKSGLKVHRKVRERMEADFQQYEHMNRRYQPKNLVKYLKDKDPSQVFDE